MSALTVDVRAKAFGGRTVLRGVGFSLAEGERAALLGPSGIGKTTLLGLIAGIDRDFEGRVERPSGRIAMVFQSPRLLPWRTLAENVALIPEAGGMERAHMLLAEVGLAEAADEYPEKVSLGMQRRAALARAIAIRPSLILMDEPLVSLDPEAAASMREILNHTLDRTGATALTATHDRREALMLSDRLLELGGRPGTLVRDWRSPLDRDQRRNARAVEAVHEARFGPLTDGNEAERLAPSGDRGVEKG